MFAVVVQADFMYFPVEQTVHAVHEAALVVVLYVCPLTQSGHTVLALDTHDENLYVPAAQTVHAVHEPALLVVL